MNRPGRCFPSKTPTLSIQLQSVHELLGLLPGADQLNYGKELLVVLVFLLLLQHQHEVVSETGLHHDPVNGARQSDVRRQKDNVLSLQRRYALMQLHEVTHDLVQRALPLAGSARTRAAVGPQLTDLLDE